MVVTSTLPTTSVGCLYWRSFHSKPTSVFMTTSKSEWHLWTPMGSMDFFLSISASGWFQHVQFSRIVGYVYGMISAAMKSYRNVHLSVCSQSSDFQTNVTIIIIIIIIIQSNSLFIFLRTVLNGLIIIIMIIIINSIIHLRANLTVWEQDAKENIWTEERWIDGRFEKTAQWGAS
jgi:hypothetical protein